MELSIGIQNLPREVNIETETSQADIEAQVEAAIADGTSLKVLSTKGSTVIIPGKAIAYVMFGAPEKRAVGFGQR